MINLLPTKDKDIIKKEVLRRFINVLGLGLFILIFVEIIFTFASFFFLDSFSKNLDDHLSTTKSVADSKNLEELETKIGGINELLFSIEAEENSVVDITGNIKMILDVLPGSIKIESFSFESKKILIRGHSDKRTDLLDFVADLEKIDCSGARCFPKTTLPVSNLLEGKDFVFSLSIDLD